MQDITGIVFYILGCIFIVLMVKGWADENEVLMCSSIVGILFCILGLSMSAFSWGLF